MHSIFHNNRIDNPTHVPIISPGEIQSHIDTPLATSRVISYNVRDMVITKDIQKQLAMRSTMKCPTCGNEVTPGEAFCGQCGTPDYRATSRISTPRMNMPSSPRSGLLSTGAYASSTPFVPPPNTYQPGTFTPAQTPLSHMPSGALTCLLIPHLWHLLILINKRAFTMMQPKLCLPYNTQLWPTTRLSQHLSG